MEHSLVAVGGKGTVGEGKDGHECTVHVPELHFQDGA